MADGVESISGSSRFRNRLAFFLALAVVLTVVPVASFRAVWWLFWTALFATVALMVLWGRAQREPGATLRAGHYGPQS